MLTRTPISLLNLVHDKFRFLVALGVIGFAVFLMFMQMGFRNALLDSNVEFIKKLNADLIVVSKRRYTSFIEHTLNLQRLYQIQGFSGVQSVSPFYISKAILKNKQNLSERPIRVFAYNPADSVFNIPEVQILQSQLSKSDALLLDIKSRSDYGSFDINNYIELNNHRFHVAGFFQLGTDFLADGNLIVSDEAFLQIFVGIPSGFEANVRYSLSEVDLGLVKLASGVQLDSLLQLFNQSLSSDIEVLTKEAFIVRDLNYWLTATPIGFMFVLGTLVGFVVGAIVLYNILYTDINDNLKQYATLKAIGYTNSNLVVIVIQEALILAILGYLPGCCVSVIFYDVVARSTGLLMHLGNDVALSILVLTLLMSIVSSLLAVRKLRQADPADIFS